MKTFLSAFLLCFYLLSFSQPIDRVGSVCIFEFESDMNATNPYSCNKAFCQQLPNISFHWNGNSWQREATASFGSTGRWYIDNNWRTFNNTYGYSYYQFSQGQGTGTTPNFSYANRGIIAPYDCNVSDFNIQFRCNSAENFNFLVSIAIMRKQQNSTANTIVYQSTTTHNSSSTTPNFLTIPVNQKIEKNDHVIISMKRESGTIRRYFYSAFNVVFN